jgi:hypothetical protein
MLDKPILYPTAYRWVILFAALDVICTWIILALGGSELNLLARKVIEAGGLPAMLAYKFALIALVLVICEHIGRLREDTGRRLARAAILLNAFPVLVGMSHLGLRAAAAA